MIFARTASGISNFRHFVCVDLVIYSEGGSVDSGGEAGWSIDSLFWKNLFSRFSSGLNVRVKSLGSKENVLPYAEKIVSGEISNSLAVMDRDHDHHKGRIIDHPCVLYTHGYSWENDAWCAGLMISMLCHNSPGGVVSLEVRRDILDRVERFFVSFYRLVFVDVLCSLAGIKGVDREKYWGFVDGDDVVNPRVNRERFKRMIGEVKGNRPFPLHYNGNGVVSGKDCYGKLFSMFCYRVLSDYYKRLTGIKGFPRDLADQLVVANIMTADFDLEPELKEYYESTFGRLSEYLMR